MEVGSGPAGMWSVPEQKCGSSSDRMEEDEKVAGNREARVKRYKEKRQSRLFAKRIRYEVRKLNAEKRPRLKVFVIKQCCSPILISYTAYFKNLQKCTKEGR